MIIFKIIPSIGPSRYTGISSPVQIKSVYKKIFVDFLMIFKGSNFLSSLMNEAGRVQILLSWTEEGVTLSRGGN